MDRRFNDLLLRAGIGAAPPRAVVAGVLVLLLLSGWALARWWPRGEPVRVKEEPEAAGPREQGQAVRVDATPVADARIFVHVVGEVRRPGVYDLASGARVSEAVAAAGGLLGSAEQEGVNLARRAEDGEQIVVPRKGDGTAQGQARGAASGGVTGGSGDTGPRGKIDLNHATLEELDSLPGVGPVTARRIVEERQANGAFRTVDDLARVSGIGPKRLESLRDLVTADRP